MLASANNCVNGAPQSCNPGQPAAEICNGVDDDCDGATDENLGQTTCGVGACQRTVNNCVNGVPQICTPGPSTAEVCNGVDDDCDGATDENLGQTSCGVGACQRTVNDCVNGAPQTCSPGQPSTEICGDGIDQDCNGADAVCPPTGEFTCPQPKGFWKNSPEAWPVSSLMLRTQVYSKSELLNLRRMPVSGDASVILAQQLIATKLNVADGSDPAPISATIVHADGLLAGFAGKLPYRVKPSSTQGRLMVSDAGVLGDYNDGKLTPTCGATRRRSR